MQIQHKHYYECPELYEIEIWTTASQLLNNSNGIEGLVLDEEQDW